MLDDDVDEVIGFEFFLCLVNGWVILVVKYFGFDFISSWLGFVLSMF